MYQKQKLYTDNNSITTATSGMIYGSQWDQVMIWMRGVKNPNASNKPFILNSMGMGNYIGVYPMKTGVNDYKVNNIYDLAGNVIEWTQEVSRGDPYYGGEYDERVPRGGYFYVPYGRSRYKIHKRISTYRHSYLWWI